MLRFETNLIDHVLAMIVTAARLRIGMKMKGLVWAAARSSRGRRVIIWIDAHLQRRVAQWLQAEGHAAVHTRDLPAGKRTGMP